mgnify:CR=1 FL=1
MNNDEHIDRIRKAAVDRLIRRGSGIAICITLDSNGCPTYSAAYPEGTIFDLCALLEAVRGNIIQNIPPHTTDGICVPASAATH